MSTVADAGTPDDVDRPSVGKPDLVVYEGGRGGQAATAPAAQIFDGQEGDGEEVGAEAAKSSDRVRRKKGPRNYAAQRLALRSLGMTFDRSTAFQAKGARYTVSNPALWLLTKGLMAEGASGDGDAQAKSNGDDDMVDKDYVDSKIEAVRAVNDARFAEVLSAITTSDERTKALFSGIDGKFAGIDGKLETMNSRFVALEAKVDSNAVALEATIDKKPGTWALISTVAAATAAIIGIGLTVMAIGGDRFDGGVGFAAVSVQQAVDAKARAIAAEELAVQNSKQVDDIGGKLDVLIDLVRPASPEKSD